MDRQTTDELARIKQIILKVVDAQAIYLFGSYAYGTPSADSDYDLYVVIPDGSMRPIDAMQLIGKAISKEETKPIDILVGTASDFQQRKHLPTIERTIVKEGILLYEKAGHS